MIAILPRAFLAEADAGSARGRASGSGVVGHAAKARRDIPLVLPHALLSFGLLLFAVLSDRPGPGAPQRGIGEPAVATVSAAHPGESARIARKI